MSATKRQWLERTGGARLNESSEGFWKRVAEIQRIERKIKRGTACVADVEKLVELKGCEEEEFEGGVSG